MEGSFEGIDEGMVKLAEDFFLEFDVLDLFEVDDMRFGDLFESEDLLTGANDLFDSAKGTSS